MERICKMAHEYAGRQVEVGDRFEVEPGDVALMLAMGRIQREEGDEVPAHVARDLASTWPDCYNTRAMTAARGSKRAYNRKAS
jgi:hypothetical protein